MKVQFVSGPKTGIIEHLQPSIAHVLIASGMAIEIKYTDFRERLRSENPTAFTPLAVQVTVQWSVAKSAISERFFISGKCSQPQCSTLAYDAPPTADLESITFLHSCGCITGPEKIPATVAAQYRKLFKPVTTLGRDEAAYFKAAQPQKSLPVDPKTYLYPIVGTPREGNESEALKNYLPSVDAPYKKY